MAIEQATGTCEQRPELLLHLSQCYPFSRLSGNRISEALDALRTYTLNPGEQLVLRAGTDSAYLYVIEGTVEVSQPDKDPLRLDFDTARVGPYRLYPDSEAVTITARDAVQLCRADAELLDYLLSWETLAAGLSGRDNGAHERVAAVRRSRALRFVPLESVEAAFQRMRPMPVRAGQEVVRQGEPGDAFYLIEDGRAEVWQTGIYDDEPQLVGVLGPGDPFGEEALIIKGSRNATVRMVEDGVLLVLNQDDFDELIQRNLIQRVGPPVAHALMESGHIPLDVRYEEEFEDGHMPGCVLVPLHDLRRRVNELDKNQKYLVYCKSGGRSAVGTLLLRQRGFDAVSLDGGLRDWPYDTVTE